MTSRQYRLYSATVEISGSRDGVAAIAERLCYFPETSGEPDLRVEITVAADTDLRPPAGAVLRTLKSDGGIRIEYCAALDELFITCGERARAVCRPRSDRVDISVSDETGSSLWLAAHPVFIVALFELLKRHGLFNLHAAAVAIGDKAVLFAGHSGAGKSTLALACCRGGFSFLSDDYVFLTSRDRVLQVTGFPEALDLLDDTIARFTELRPLLLREPRPGWPKRQVRVEDHWQPVRLQPCQPAALIFPTVGQVATSTLAAMDPRQAVTELVSNIQATVPSLAQAHLDAIGTLVRDTPCYRLQTGQDLDILPQRLRSLLDPAVNGPHKRPSAGRDR